MNSFVNSSRNFINNFVKNTVCLALVKLIRPDLTAQFFEHVHHRNDIKRADVEKRAKSESRVHVF